MKKRTLSASIAALMLAAAASGIQVFAEDGENVDVTVTEAVVTEAAEEPAEFEDELISYDDSVSGDITYIVNTDGTVTVTAYNSSAENVVIPDKVNGRYVTALKSGLFCRNTTIKTVTINCTKLTTIPENCFEACTSLASVSLPEGLTTIGFRSFLDCSALKSITIPSTCTNIVAARDYYSDGAFANCTSLSQVIFKQGTKPATIGKNAFLNSGIESITIPSNYTVFGLGAFQNCKKLKSVDIKANIKTIPESCFNGCTALESVSIPEGVETIGFIAFIDCTALKSITIPSTCTNIVAARDYYSDGAFANCTSLSQITLKQGTKPATIGKNAFYNTAVETVTIPANYTTIGSYAFAECDSLTSAKINGGADVTVIGTGAFANSKKLKTVELNANIKTIPESCFEACTALDTINIPEGVETIGFRSFLDCTALKSITIPSTCTNIVAARDYYSDGAFANCTSLSEVIFKQGTKPATIGKNAFLNSGIESITIPSNYTVFGLGAFQNCKKLKSVDIKANIKTIPESCFNGCTALESVSIPEGVETIGFIAFIDCSALKSVTIPSTCTNIVAARDYYSDGAFANCTSLSQITFKQGTKPATIGKNAFYNTAVETVTIPANYTTIGSYAFAECDSLTSAVINGGADVTVIGTGAFTNSKKLKTVTINANIKTIPESCFEACTALESVNIPEGVETIGFRSFIDCSALKSITIPSTCTNIVAARDYYGDGAFTNCTSLSEVIFRPGTKSAVIGKHAFYNTAVTNIVIPSNYTSIGSYAFEDCKKLITVIIQPGAEKCTIGTAAFNNCSELRYAVLSHKITSLGERAFAECNNATVVTNENTQFASNAYKNVLANVRYNIFNGKATITSVDSMADKVVIPCYISGYPTSPYYNISYTGQVIIDHIYSGNYCVICNEYTTPKFRLSAGNRNVQLSWDPISVATKYAVYNYYNGEFSFVSEASDLTFTRTGLNNGETYGFAVSAYCNGKWTELDARNVLYSMPGSQISAFVERLYTTMLGRASEAAGKSDWVNKLNKGYTATEVASGFVLSDELAFQNLTNTEFVSRMYRTFMNREPDAAGLADWTNALDNGCSYAYVLNSFVLSAEFGNICNNYGIETGRYNLTEPRDQSRKLTAFTSRMYTKALNRAYEVNGLNYWTGRYINREISLNDMAFGFIFSEEFTNKNLSDEQYVDTLYATFFDRPADATGKADWLNRMHTQGYSREDVLNGFLGAEEFGNLVKSFGL